MLLFLVLPAFATAVALLCLGQTADALQTVPYKMNFQGRLTDASGNPKADGIYNIKFRIYNTANTAVWTEDRLVSATQGVQVTDGLFTVQLGSVTPLDPALFNNATTNQGTMTLEVELPTPATATSSSPTWTEGAMTPRNPIATSAYAFNSDTLDGLDSTDLVRNQNSAQQTATNYWISGTGRADTSLQAPLIDTATAGVLSIGTTNATGINLNKDVTVAAGMSLTLAGGITSSRPASPTEGMIYYDTDTKQLLTYANGKWQADRSEAVLVAASDSSVADKAAADYVGDGNTAAAGDGDQVQINSALTAASGKKVVLLAGTYTADATILIPNNTTLAGAGRGTLIQLGDIDVTDNLIENSDTTTGTGVVIRDLKLDGQKSLNTAGTQNGIYLNGMGNSSGATAVPGAKILDVSVNNMNGYGIYLNNSDNNMISRVSMKSNWNGLAAVGSSYNTFNDSAIYDSNYGIYTDAAYESTFSDNIINAASYGIKTGASGNIVISGNSISNGTQIGIDINNGSYSYTVTGNKITGYFYAGVSVWWSVSNTITSNIISDNGARGIEVGGGSDNNAINNNVFADNGSSTTNNAIIISGSGNDRNSIANNNISDVQCSTTCRAITIDSGSTVTYVSDNTLGSNGTISDSGTGTIYANQSLAENGGNITNRTANSATAFQIQNASGANLLTADTTNGEIEIGSASLAGKLVISDGSSNTITLSVNALAGNYTLAIPTVTQNDEICLKNTANCGGGSGVTSVGTFSGTSIANGASIAGTEITFGPADASNPGMVTTGTQTFAGDKTFSGAINGLTVSSGTVSVGTWNGTAISGAYGGTGQTTTTAGDLLIGAAGNTWSKLAIGGNGTCLTSNGTTASWGGCGGSASTLQGAYDGDADGSDAIIALTATDGGILLRDTATPLTTAFAVQNSGGTASYFSASSTAIVMQDSSGNSALLFDSTTSELRVYENVASPSRYARVYYDTAANAAVFAASSGATQIGAAGAGGDINMTLNGAATDKLNATKTFTSAGAYSGSDFNFTRNLTGTTYALTGNLMKLEDTSTFTSGSSSPNLLYINQNNTSATGNLILARTGGATDKFKVDVSGNVTAAGSISSNTISSTGSITAGNGLSVTTGNVSIASGASYTGAGAVTVSSASNTNLTLLAGGTGKVVVKPGTNSSSSFEVQNASGTAMLLADSTNNQIKVGVSDTTGTLLVLDTKTDTGDPTGANGGMYYNSNAGRFRCYENGAWADCLGYRRLVTLTSDTTSTASTACRTVTGASFPVKAGVTYRFRATFIRTATANTIGASYGANLSAGSATLFGLSFSNISSANAILGSGQSALNTCAGPTASSLATTGTIDTIQGVITPSQDATFQLQYAPETATAGQVIKTGSTLEWW